MPPPSPEAAREIAWRDPARAFERLRAHLPGPAAFLDSSLAGGGQGRYSYLALDPYARLTFDGRACRLDGAPAGRDPFARLAAELARTHRDADPDLPPFQGGAVGWLGYDLGHVLERLPAPRQPRRWFHDLALGLYDTVVSFDHQQERAWIVAQRPSELDRYSAILGEDDDTSAAEPPPVPPPPVTVHSNFSRREYEAAVGRVVEYILAGDIFQANISQRLTARLAEGDSAWALYRRLRAASPAPFAAHLDWGGQVLASASPERFLRLDAAGVVETRPIKGTRPRGATEAEDARLAAELLASEKDRAENVMIVDLLRNDLSRVCRPFSVETPVVCGLESFADVHHLVSTVTGRLEEGRGAVDLLRAAFPGGSVTGAPKIRAMEVIAEIEPTRRGPYCGSVAWLGFDGAMDSSIVIRSFALRGRQVRFQVGGGVVADSDPAAEYEETLAKARGLLAGLRGDGPEGRREDLAESGLIE